MKIYVDEMPEKCCKECKILGVFDWCNYLKDCVSDEIKNNKRHVLCPLKTTQSLKQQVREEAVEEIRKQLKDMDFLANDTEFGERFSCYSKYKVLDILLTVERNQVKGENNVKD